MRATPQRFSREEIRAALLTRNADHESEFYVLVTEPQAVDLASGFVPLVVIAQVRTMLDWQDQDRRRAARPDATTKPSQRRTR